MKSGVDFFFFLGWGVECHGNEHEKKKKKKDSGKHRTITLQSHIIYHHRRLHDLPFLPPSFPGSNIIISSSGMLTISLYKVPEYTPEHCGFCPEKMTVEAGVAFHGEFSARKFEEFQVFTSQSLLIHT